MPRTLRHWDTVAFAVLLAVFNLPLLTGHFSTQFVFQPAAVLAGEWWRLFSHCFVHVSWYNLALDAAAFFLAYVELREWRFARRLAFVAAAAGGSLAVSWWAAPAVATHGLCGLSGVAHGLTALVGLELLRRELDPTLQLAGLLTFVGVVAKCIFEAVTGEVIFASWHLGLVGVPIAVCHAGGVIGALISWSYFARRRQLETMRQFV